MTSSFLEKLKKGMGVDELEETKKTPKKTKEVLPVVEDKEKEETVKKAVVKRTIRAKTKKTSVQPKEKKKEKVKTEEIEKEAPEPATVLVKEETWPQPDGQLAIDVYQTDSELVIQSAIAGVKPGNIDITIEDDMIIIKGKRKKLTDEEGDYFYQECYWGSFSRQIISPVEIDPGRVDASFKEGILTIRIPKIVRNKKAKIVIKG